MLFINEWRFCLRQPLVILCMILIPIFSIVLSGGAQEGSYNLGSQLQLAHVILLMMVLPIVLGALSPIVFLPPT
jgi:ABC-2 type transport system permease protein